MKPIRCFVLLIFIALSLQAADTLVIAACDEAVINHFGDIITLSRHDGVLRRYTGGKLENIFSGKSFSSKLILQNPLRPVPDDPDLIYILDAANGRVIAWDRFLNVHSITPLSRNINSPAEFTVTSEHDWLIYDRFNEQILQVHPNQHYLYRWGDKPVSGDLYMFNINQHVLLHLKDMKRLRICDDKGRSIREYDIPDSLQVRRVLSLNIDRIGLVCDDGVHIWEPDKKSCRFISPLGDVVFMRTEGASHTLISSRGIVVTIP
jgi:hypothetical protein